MLSAERILTARRIIAFICQTVETADNGKRKQKKRTVSKRRINAKGARCKA